MMLDELMEHSSEEVNEAIKNIALSDILIVALLAFFLLSTIRRLVCWVSKTQDIMTMTVINSKKLDDILNNWERIKLT